jgi:predicted transcriptional regulator
MVSSSQIKAARAMLGWSAIELANRSGVGSASIKRYEVQSGIPIANTKNLMVIRNTFEEAGIEFTGDPLVNPGVTLRIKSDD